MIIIKFYLLIFILNQFGNVLCSDVQLPLRNCFVKSGDKNWKLVYSNEFVEEGELAGWMPEQELGDCHGNFIGQVSCNLARNIFSSSGYMVLAARHQNYQKFKYTAAKLTSNDVFSYGRFEIRAAQPVGKQIRTSIFTVNSNDTYWHENGQVDIMNKNEEQTIYRGVHFANSRDQYKGLDLSLPGTYSNNKTEFHVYGFEWSQKELRFFLDDKLSDPIQFSPEKSLSPFHRLRFQIGVGGQFFNPPYPGEFEKLSWGCPALIVDYVRVYQKVSDVASLEQCQMSRPMDDEFTVERLCAQALNSAGSTISIERRNYVNFIFMVVIFVLLINCLSF